MNISSPITVCVLKLQHNADLEPTTEEECKSTKGPSAVVMKTAVATELWHLEMEKFHNEVAEEAEVVYELALEEWHQSKICYFVL